MVACGSLLGVILISLAEAYGPALEEWVSQDPRSRLRPTAAAFFVAIAGPMLGFAGYFWRIGGRVIRAERFPAPDAAVFSGHGRVARTFRPPTRARDAALRGDLDSRSCWLRHLPLASCVLAHARCGLT